MPYYTTQVGELPPNIHGVNIRDFFSHGSKYFYHVKVDPDKDFRDSVIFTDQNGRSVTVSKSFAQEHFTPPIWVSEKEYQRKVSIPE